LARQGQGVANGTINREVAVLGRMQRLAYEHGKLLRLPVIHKPKEAAPDVARRLAGTIPGTIETRAPGGVLLLRQGRGASEGRD
jgi:hypothetical protein